MSFYYTLNENNEPVAADMDTYHKWRGTSWAKHIVGKNDVNGFRVSTVFLGLDHRYGDDDRPVLWETLVFDRRSDADNMGECDGKRYTSHADAVEGHAAFVAKFSQPQPEATP